MPSNNVCTSWMLMIVTGINLTDHPTASPADLNNHWCHFLTATSGCSRERGSQNTARSLANCSRSRTQQVVQMDRYRELPPHQSFDTMENQASGIKSATPTAVNCSLYLATRNILNLKHYCPTVVLLAGCVNWIEKPVKSLDPRAIFSFYIIHKRKNNKHKKNITTD